MTELKRVLSFKVLLLIVINSIMGTGIFFLPALGAKKFGGSKWGITGSVLGMLIGIFVFPPWGMIIGAFAGAVIGELSAGKKKEEAIKAGIGVFLGTITATFLKVAASGIMLYYYIVNLW